MKETWTGEYSRCGLSRPPENKRIDSSYFRQMADHHASVLGFGRGVR